MKSLIVFLMMMSLTAFVYGQYVITPANEYNFYDQFTAEPLAFEDINHNGYLDMTLGSNYYSTFLEASNLAVSFNSGGANFGAWNVVAENEPINDLKYGFLRNSSDRDLVAAYNDHTEVLWKVNNTLVVQQNNLPGGSFLDLGRITHDGYDDLALVSENNIKIFNSTNGIFSITPIQTISEQTDFVRLVDLDRTSSFFDLISLVGTNVKIRKNNSGTLGSPFTIPVGEGVMGVEVGDLNYDDYPDLVVVYGTGQLKIYLNDGQGNIPSTPSQTIFSNEFNYYIADIAIGDMNNDGWNDLVIAYYEGKITIWINSKTSPLFQSNPQQTISQFLPYTDVHTLVLVDVENTGGLSVAISTTYTSIQGNTVGTVYLFKHEGNPAPAPPKNLTISTSANQHPYLSWDGNTERDLAEYKIYKRLGSGNWNFLASTTSTFFEDTEEEVSKNPWVPGTMAYYRVTAVDISNNESDYSNTVSIPVRGYLPDLKTITLENRLFFLPTEPELYSNYPNPINPSTTITFALSQGGPVMLTIYSVTGQRIATLVDGQMQKGYHSVVWNGVDEQGQPVGSGIYIYEL